MYVCTYVRTYVRTNVRTYVRTYARTYVRTYAMCNMRYVARTYVRTYVRTYADAEREKQTFAKYSVQGTRANTGGEGEACIAKHSVLLLRNEHAFKPTR